MFPVPEFAVVLRMAGPTAIAAVGRPPMMTASVSAGTRVTAVRMAMVPVVVSARDVAASGVMPAATVMATPVAGCRISDGGG
jgi:hypothetical protein